MASITTLQHRSLEGGARACLKKGGQQPCHFTRQVQGNGQVESDRQILSLSEHPAVLTELGAWQAGLYTKEPAYALLRKEQLRFLTIKVGGCREG